MPLCPAQVHDPCTSQHSPVGPWALTSTAKYLVTPSMQSSARISFGTAANTRRSCGHGVGREAQARPQPGPRTHPSLEAVTPAATQGGKPLAPAENTPSRVLRTSPSPQHRGPSSSPAPHTSPSPSHLLMLDGAAGPTQTRQLPEGDFGVVAWAAQEGDQGPIGLGLATILLLHAGLGDLAHPQKA